jgi:hypothetical protein
MHKDQYAWIVTKGGLLRRKKERGKIGENKVTYNLESNDD